MVVYDEKGSQETPQYFRLGNTFKRNNKKTESADNKWREMCTGLWTRINKANNRQKQSWTI